MDRETREPFELLDEIEKTLALDVTPLTWPIGTGRDFKGTYDLRNGTIRKFGAEEGEASPESVEALVGAAGASVEQALERPRYFRIRIVLELSDGSQVPALQALLPRVEDIFQTYLRELQPSDIEGSANIFRLKEELLRRVNMAVQPNKVDAILFKELLVQ